MRHFSFPHWMRRFAAGFALISVALVMMAPLAACGGGSSSSGSSSTSSGPVTLTIWDWGADADKAAALWNSTHPNIQVKLVNVGVSTTEYNKLYTAIKANNEPDLAVVEYQYLPSFEATGSLVDLSPYGASSVANQYVP